MEELKVNEQAPAIQAAVALENRLTRMESKIDNLVELTGQLNERVGIQNGRVSSLEKAHKDLQEDIRVQRELVEAPKWGRFDSVASQVRTLWEWRAKTEQAETIAEESADKKRRWWSGIKVRADTMLSVLGIGSLIASIIISVGPKIIGG